MEQVIEIVQVLMGVLIVPIVNLIKQNLNPAWHFIDWLITAVLVGIVSWGLCAIFVSGYTIADIWRVVLTVMFVGSGVHAGLKTIKANGKLKGR